MPWDGDVGAKVIANQYLFPVNDIRCLDSVDNYMLGYNVLCRSVMYTYRINLHAYTPADWSANTLISMS